MEDGACNYSDVDEGQGILREDDVWYNSLWMNENSVLKRKE